LDHLLKRWSIFISTYIELTSDTTYGNMILSTKENEMIKKIKLTNPGGHIVSVKISSGGAK